MSPCDSQLSNDIWIKTVRMQATHCILPYIHSNILSVRCCERVGFDRKRRIQWTSGPAPSSSSSTTGALLAARMNECVVGCLLPVVRTCTTCDLTKLDRPRKQIPASSRPKKQNKTNDVLKEGKLFCPFLLHFISRILFKSLHKGPFAYICTKSPNLYF